MPHQERSWSWFDEGVKAFKNEDWRFARTCFHKSITIMKADLSDQGAGPDINRITRELGDIIFSDYCPTHARKRKGLIFLADFLKEQKASPHFIDKLIEMANELDLLEQNKSSKDPAVVLRDLRQLFTQMKDQI
jgi:hypothetical protein